ncbi:MAG: hypothetical protein ACXV7D_13545 [Thermoanaerobaculia bacterium]
MKRNILLAAVFVVCTTVAILFLTKTLTGQSSVVIANATKIAMLVIAASFALRSAYLLGSGNPARRPWLLLGAGLASMCIGQVVLAWYQYFTGSSPFPSPADFWFVLAYPLIIVALVSFAVTYTRGGFPAQGLTSFAVIMVIAAAAIAWPVLLPVATAHTGPLSKALNLVYSSLDLLLMVPVAVLLRITSRFRGGAVWPIWLSLLVGFVFTAAGDVLFAYLSALGHNELDPVIDAMYIVAYGNLAWGALFQERLLTA